MLPILFGIHHVYALAYVHPAIGLHAILGNATPDRWEIHEVRIGHYIWSRLDVLRGVLRGFQGRLRPGGGI